jgi:hypothetical protein
LKSVKRDEILNKIAKAKAIAGGQSTLFDNPAVIAKI